MNTKQRKIPVGTAIPLELLEKIDEYVYHNSECTTRSAFIAQVLEDFFRPKVGLKQRPKKVKSNKKGDKVV